MKFHIITVWLISLHLLCPVLLSGQQWQKITTNLQEQMKISPQDTHKAYLLLSDRLDIFRFESMLNANSLPLNERPPLLIKELQRKAAATQPSLLRQLENMGGIRQGATQAFWITNVVFVEATNDALLGLSENPSIAEIGFNAPVQVIETSAPAIPAMLPNANGNTEIGLRVIGAPEMWDMGYTGYGTRAMINDTGVDPAHPALFRQYAYHLVPREQAWNGETETDCDGHGTHVAGTILGLDYLERDTIGVAFEAKWIGGIGLGGDCENGEDVAGTIAMFQYALNPDGDILTVDDIPHVINNSWETNSSCGNQFSFDIFNSLGTAGIAVVFAAGNNGSDPATVSFLANFNWSLVRNFSVGNVNGNVPSLPMNSSSSRGPSTCGGEGSVLIKPEVSAPGTTVRSAYLDGGYANLSGTSMAAPHVSGAVLLLKEAFPYLSGEELLLALYYSASDMGEPGEDNAYGMGIINLPAAFQYLVEEGYVPEPPRSFEGNARILRLETPEFHCGNTVQLSAIVHYAGPDTLEQLELAYRIGNMPAQTYEWEGQAAPGEPHLIDLPFTAMPQGTYEAEVAILSANGLADERPEDNILKMAVSVLEEIASPAVFVGDSVCAGSAAMVYVVPDGAAEVQWYGAADGGSSIGSGSPLLLEDLTASSLIYAQTSPIQKIGKPDNTSSNTQLSNQPHGLRFNALYPFTLKSVKIYAEEAGGRLLQLVKPDGSITTKVVSVQQTGEQRIELDLNISPGDGYILRMNAGKPLLLNSGAQQGYPMVVPGIAAITTSTVGPTAYFYFYDWEISYQERCGRSAVAIPVSAAGSDTPAPLISSTTDTVDLAQSGAVMFSATTTGYDAWNWALGDGQAASGASVPHTYTTTGTYTVAVTARTLEGCTKAGTKPIVVVDNTEIVSTLTPEEALKLLVFPNPTDGQVHVQLEGQLVRDVRLTLTDLPGRVLQQQIQDMGAGMPASLSLAPYPTGTYLILVEANGMQSVRRIVKAK